MMQKLRRLSVWTVSILFVSLGPAYLYGAQQMADEKAE
jgi:uncharacterized membrane protein